MLACFGQRSLCPLIITFEDSFGTWKQVNSIWKAPENIHVAIINSLISRRQTQCMMQSTSSWRRVLRVGSRASKTLCSTTSTPSRPTQAPCARCKASTCNTLYVVHEALDVIPKVSACYSFPRGHSTPDDKQTGFWEETANIQERWYQGDRCPRRRHCEQVKLTLT